jgi:stage III sporulation protein AG
MFDLKKLLEQLKNDEKNNKVTNIIVVCLIGVMLLIATSFFKGTSDIIPTIGNNINNPVSNKTENNSTNTKDSSELKYENDQEDKLTSLLENMDGVGKVKVMISYDNSVEEVPAYNETSTTSITNEVDNSGGKRTTVQNSSGNTVVVTNDNGTTKPYIVKKYNPKITGVVIMAQGAEDSNLKLNITIAVSELFDISVDKVNVLPMKDSNIK